MTNKNITLSFDLGDPRSKKLAEVLGSEICKKIIKFLSEKIEASEKDIADALNSPLNTIEYNLKKLIESGIVEKSKNFFWSKKGRKIINYKLSNKSILIKPSFKKIPSKIKSITPVVIISGILALILRQITIAKQKTLSTFSEAETIIASFDTAERTAQIMTENGNFFFTQPSPAWIWFLGGMLVAIFIFSILNWRKL
jgi:DNA-binding transcriptional ArsR family regulator